MKLTLSILDKKFPIYGGNIKQIELQITTYGVSGDIKFWSINDDEYGGSQKDDLFESAIKDDPIFIDLSIVGYRTSNEAPSADPVPLAIKALVRDRSITEQPFFGTDKPAVLARWYQFTFADAAAVLWRQHYPCALDTEKSWKDVITQNQTEQIKFTCEGEYITAKKPLIFVNLDPLKQNTADFYDYISWLCDSKDQILSYNYKDQSYRIADTLPKAAKPVPLSRLDIGRISVLYQEVPRRQTQVLNAFSGDPRNQPTKLKTGITPIAHDHLIRTPIAADYDARAKLEEQRLAVSAPQLRLEFQRMPLQLFGPWDLLDLTAAKGWEAADIAVPKVAKDSKLRVAELSLKLDASESELQAREGGNIAHYFGTLSVMLEPESERTARVPAYRTPRYPAKVEGIIVSEIGDEKEETYDIVTDDKTSQRSYKIKLPLFKDQVVKAPFEPIGLSGHFYAPFYRGERVLCALHQEEAAVVGCLDWRAGATAPLESQGNQLFFGKTLESCVAVSLLYEEDIPVYTLQRTHKKDDEDVQTVKIKEGQISVFVGHGKDGSAAEKILTMHVTLDKKGGATLKLENPDKKTTQTISLDGTALTMKVQGEEDTSTYTQVADTVTIEAKHIKLKAETITATSTKESSWSSDDTLALSSKKDMTLKTDAAWSLTAAKDASADADNIKATAKQAANIKGTDVSVSGTSSLTGKAPRTALTGDTSVTIKGASIKVQASAALNCESSATANFKGALVNISGSLIKVG